MYDDLMRCDAITSEGKRCSRKGTGYFENVWVCYIHGEGKKQFSESMKRARKLSTANYNGDMRQRSREQRRREFERKKQQWIADGAKVCTKCGRKKRLNQFALTKTKMGTATLSGPCIPCKKILRNEWEQRRKEEGRRQNPAAEARSRQAAQHLKSVEDRGERICPRCKLMMPLQEFIKHKTPNGNGYHGYCRKCRRDFDLEWKQRRRGEVSEGDAA